MQCDICAKKKATVHLTEIVDEQMSELHLCEDCAREKSVQMEQQFGLADLLAGLSDFSGNQPTKDSAEKVKVKCANCGLSYDDFRKMGRLGCSDCYVSFREYLGALLKKIHGAAQHRGKIPARALSGVKTKTLNLKELKDQLQLAIQNENFEEAAYLRDKIREFEKKGNQDK
ncbi:MAG: UvrB/UvrC motif-containing protein [Candidatus Omnitrophota bacterium]